MEYIDNQDLKEIKESIKVIAGAIDKLSAHNQTLGLEIKNLEHRMDSMKIKQALSLKSMYLVLIVFICAALFLGLAECALPYLPHQFLDAFQSWTAWITLFSIVGCIFSSAIICPVNRTLGILSAIANGFLFICYLGYVLIDFGGAHPEAAAIAFNVSTICRSVNILLLGYVVAAKRNGCSAES